jgi:hypothetical protein
MGSKKRRSKQLLVDPKGTRIFWKLKTLGCILWRTRFGENIGLPQKILPVRDDDDDDGDDDKKNGILKIL